MITEDYVSFEVAKLLKEKGFDEVCESAYTEGGQYLLSCYKGIAGRRIKNSESLNFSYSVVSPTLQMAMKWLRKKHNLYIEVFVTWKNKIPHYQWRINNLITQDTIVDTPCLEKPEEAVEVALKYSLKNLIQL